MVNISSNNQYITYEEFKNFCEFFLKKSKQLNYNWEWMEDSNHLKKTGYLKFSQVIEIDKKEISSTVFKFEKDDNLDKIINDVELKMLENQYDDDNVLNEDSKTRIIWEWHIIYSPIFQIPVLFFNAWDEEYQPIDILSNKEIFPIKPLYMPIITQKDHPILGVPYYYAHPCTTGQNMNMLYNININKDELNNTIEEINIDNTDILYNTTNTNENKYNNYIASWLSTIGLIKVDINYFI
ncbi:hypothetical protein BCR32DRAFT_270087 [Anaeromyces robustus]|uniref:Ubiquitin-like-conjugating enzyme ATG10 n=1 Tax=Anaeromyces robustus TaxID=1754192 RepID=A0A1Y1WXY4_9FUNG|nr:hypothetical protein BCR32DRAFT_270087 [Anaeromyces robustus]|eukprot:ORX78439.1 hypothetical protein BCR32DRAFT_270087 [Anaeromyces robustus]